jgi:hypothetical protein
VVYVLRHRANDWLPSVSDVPNICCRAATVPGAATSQRPL